MTRRKHGPGTVLSIPIAEDQVAFCRLLNRGMVEFYDTWHRSSASVAVEDLAPGPVAFRVPVMNESVNSRRWKVIGQVELTSTETEQIHTFYKQDPISGVLTLFWTDPDTGQSHERPATVTECEGLEAAAVWSSNHIEDRLRDHFAGLPNKWVKLLRPK